MDRSGDHDSWPHKWLVSSARTIVQLIPSGTAVQRFQREVDEMLKKFYGYRINADYLAAGVKPQSLATDALALERLIPDLFAVYS